MSGDTKQTLEKRIKDLEAELTDLRKENVELRQSRNDYVKRAADFWNQLQAGKPAPRPPVRVSLTIEGG